MLKYLIIICASTTISCAGPTSPFGAINTLLPDSRVEAEKNPSSTPPFTVNEPANIEFYPRRQLLHQNKDFKIIIRGIRAESPTDYLKIQYNHLDVTHKLLHVAEISQHDNFIELTIPRLHLPANHYNDIKVSYQEPHQRPTHATYFPPSCRVYDNSVIENTEPFAPPKYFIQLIETFAPREQINPSVVAGIIAQESGFDPKAVSWAKAIGLTQMTPLAEQQIIDSYDHYPRYPNLNRYSYFRIKTLINSGKVNENEEWRLNPSYSIQGGIAFLKYIDNYWRLPRNAHILKQLPGDPNVVYSQVLLASYNSGPARVKYAIKRKGARWLLDRKLQEAHKYVNRVFSYCYHFSFQEPAKEYVNAF
ncbi:MAG: transglycosylase SLT domain-containing protein [Bdellovibrionales bacterium]|nr:transglycosylase SLT domain-containing protein [Bdellovibrionales bacterium]